VVINCAAFLHTFEMLYEQVAVKKKFRVIEFPSYRSIQFFHIKKIILFYSNRN